MKLSTKKISFFVEALQFPVPAANDENMNNVAEQIAARNAEFPKPATQEEFDELVRNLNLSHSFKLKFVSLYRIK